MAEAVTKHTFAVGQEVFRQGDVPRDAFLIERGRIEISRLNDGQKVVIGFKAIGDIFGEMALIDKAPRMATATAVEPTVCIAINDHLFKEQLDKATPMLKKILRTFTSNIRHMSERAANHSADHS